MKSTILFIFIMFCLISFTSFLPTSQIRVINDEISDRSSQIILSDEEKLEETKEKGLSEILKAFYQKFNPSKINHISSILRRFKNRESELFHDLEVKYGEHPLFLSSTSSSKSKSSNKKSKIEQKLDDFFQNLNVNNDQV